MRIHFIDAMRSVLMVLGVVLHAARVYTVSGRWELHDSAATNPLFDGIVALISSFRMPAFFVIAGFFAQMTLERHGRKYFLWHRLRRLAIPFLATALLLNSLQLWLQYRLPVLAESSLPFPGSVAEIFTSGRWLQHLWFLVVLLIFSLFALPLSKSVATKTVSGQGWWQGHWLAVFLLVGAFSEMAAHSLLHVVRILMAGPFVFGLVDPVSLLTFVPFFLFGLWLFTNPARLKDFCRPGLATLVAALVAVLLHRWLITLPETRLQTFVSWGYDGIVHWLGCHLCFSAFWWTVRRPSGFWRYCSDASYTVYLAHHLLVILIAGSLLNVAWSANAKFLTVSGLVLLATVIIHELFVRRIRVLSFLFNGK
jgi:glucan biosynthesis protein C